MRELTLDEVSAVNGAAAFVVKGVSGAGGSESKFYKPGLTLTEGGGSFSGSNLKFNNLGTNLTSKSGRYSFGVGVSGNTKDGVSGVKVEFRLQNK